MADKIETDVIVAGAGMAGLSSAVQAAVKGAKVVVLEKGENVGGTLHLSAGLIWTFETFEDAREEVPKGNPHLQKLIVENMRASFEWLDDLGIDLQDQPFIFPNGEEFGISLYDDRQAKQMDPKSFSSKMVSIIEDNGGEVLTNTPLSELITTPSGEVLGAIAQKETDTYLRIESDSVIIATGGFQGNESLVQKYITEHTDNLWLRSNPLSTGDGFLAAKEVGAKTAGDLSKFSGPNLLAPPASCSPDAFVELLQSYASLGIAINRGGRRIYDESESVTENPLAQEIARSANGWGCIVIDQKSYETDHLGGKPLGFQLEQAKDKFGGRVATAASFDGLREVLYDWNVNGDQAIETIRQFNEFMRSDEGDKLDPPRYDNHVVIDTPPYHAVAVQPSITFSNGGLAVTEDMEVMNRIGSSTSFAPYGQEEKVNVIDGLYAAGVDVGNISHDHYFGGLGPALVTGRIAGRKATERTEQIRNSSR